MDEDPAKLERTKAKKPSMEWRERRDQEGGKRREGKEENEKRVAKDKPRNRRRSACKEKQEQRA